MKTKILSVFAIFFFAFIFTGVAQDIVGQWKTIDDVTGDTKSIVEIYKGGNGKYFGKVIKLFRAPDEDQNPVCDKCTGSKHNKPILNMIVITNMEKTGSNMWKNGKIMDPDNGKTYDCKMWLDGGKLQVRGYLGWSALGRSQTWIKN